MKCYQNITEIQKHSEKIIEPNQVGFTKNVKMIEDMQINKQNVSHQQNKKQKSCNCLKIQKHSNIDDKNSENSVLRDHTAR